MNGGAESVSILANDSRFLDSAPGRLLSETPLGFVDIGARGGVHPLVASVASVTAVLGFEPDEAECKRIMAQHAGGGEFACFALEPIALAGVEGPVILHLMNTPTNHSLLPTNPGFVKRYQMVKWHEVGQLELFATTLDSVLFNRRKDEPFWGAALKLDTQGTEFEILQGAARTLDERCVAVVTEVSFCELYQGQRLFSEVEALLRRHGFAFYGFDTPHHRSCRSLDKAVAWGRERLFQADAVFFKDPLGGDAAAGAELDPYQQACLFTMATVLGYHDFALEIGRRYWSGEDLGRLERLVRGIADLPARRAADDARALAAAVAADPAQANILVGKFVDARRQRNDYDDVPFPEIGS